jgi:hypothetical protein
MIWEPPNLNLLLAWTWLLAGFASGALLGTKFANETWLGGYTSLRRRMYRLGHISFFGLGFVNLMFYLTAKLNVGLPATLISVASLAFVIGALTMPACCLILAHHTTARPPVLFAIPVTALLTGGMATLWMLLQI